MTHPARNAIIFFFLGIFAALLFVQIPESKALFEGLENDGYLGVLLTGVLYAFSITAASASVIFVNMTESLNPLIAALVGGTGSMAYDALVFLLSRKAGQNRIQLFFQHHSPFQKHLPVWVTLVVGGAILASPLPDELAAGFLGVTHFSTGRFLLFSYLMNALGIFLLVSV